MDPAQAARQRSGRHRTAIDGEQVEQAQARGRGLPRRARLPRIAMQRRRPHCADCKQAGERKRDW
jgi:hypothetical protein